MTPYLKPGIMDIDDIIASEFGTTKELMQSRTRKREATDARRFAMWYRVTKLGETPKSAGYKYDRDRCTALNARDKVPDLIETDKFFRANTEEAIRKLSIGNQTN